MPVAPTKRMRRLATRWLTDEVTLSTVTYATDTRPLGKATEVDTGAVTVAALIRQTTVDLQDSTTVRRDVRDLTVWVADASSEVLTTDTGVALTDDDGNNLLTDESAFVPDSGLRCTITACDDNSLVGRYGEVIYVERDSVRAVRRLTVRIPNDD